MSLTTEIESDYLSKIERGVVLPPTSGEMLSAINEALGLNNQQSVEMLQLAQSGVATGTARAERPERIPALFRTADNGNLSDEQITELYTYLNNSSV